MTGLFDKCCKIRIFYDFGSLMKKWREKKRILNKRFYEFPTSQSRGMATELNRSRNGKLHSTSTEIPMTMSCSAMLTTEMLSFATRQNVMCFPCNIVCSTRRVNRGSDQGNWFKCAKNVRSWNSTGSEMTSLSAERRNGGKIIENNKSGFVLSSIPSINLFQGYPLCVSLTP